MSADGDKVMKGVRYFKDDHNLLPNSRKNSEFYTNDHQFVEFVAFNDDINVSPTYNTDEHPVDYLLGKMNLQFVL